MNSRPTNLIIIAAGLGSRLGSLTQECPKCLLEVGDKTILEHQLKAFQHHPWRTINIVCGFKSEILREMVESRFPNLHIQFFENPDYRNNNILASLMHARANMKDGFVASYSDILFTSSVVDRCLEASHYPISLIFDQDWRKSYEGRTLHPETEAETLILNSEGSIKEIGKTGHDKALCHGEFIGMFSTSGKGAELWMKQYDIAQESFSGKPFFQAPTFQKAYITDFVQHLTLKGFPVHGEPIAGGWMEIDTPEDLVRARQLNWS